MRVNRGNNGGDGSSKKDDTSGGMSAPGSRGGGGGEANAPQRGGAADLDATPDTADRFGPGGGSSGNPDVTGTRDATEE